MQCEAIGGPTPAASMFRWYVDMERGTLSIRDQQIEYYAGHQIIQQQRPYLCSPKSF